MTLNEAMSLRTGRRGAPRWLVAMATLESVSLLILVVNRLTFDVRGLAAALGPLHGALYLSVLIAAIALRLGSKATLLALVPAVGGLLVVRAAHRTRDVRTVAAEGPPRPDASDDWRMPPPEASD